MWSRKKLQGPKNLRPITLEGGCMLAIASMPFEVGFRPRLAMVCPNTQRRCILQLVQIVQTTVHICEVHRDVCV